MLTDTTYPQSPRNGSAERKGVRKGPWVDLLKGPAQKRGELTCESSLHLWSWANSTVWQTLSRSRVAITTFRQAPRSPDRPYLHHIVVFGPQIWLELRDQRLAKKGAECDSPILHVPMYGPQESCNRRSNWQSAWPTATYLSAALNSSDADSTGTVVRLQYMYCRQQHKKI